MRERFAALWRDLGARSDPGRVFDSLVRRYSEPHRKYHGLDHVRWCLDFFDGVADLAERPLEVEIALWFHDAVYDTRAEDNEARSADLAAESLAAGGIMAEIVERVRRMILATVHDAPAPPGDAALTADIDIATLAVPWEEFEVNGRRIREEYAWVPEADFRAGRADVLRKFLDRPAIYVTPGVRERCGTRARENLARALADYQQ